MMTDVPGGPLGSPSRSSVELACTERGSGPPLVLVHGSLTDARYWERSGMAEALSTRFRTLTPSRRHNHPNPPRPDGGGYDAHDDAADLLALLEARCPGGAHLLGHSYGAYAALLAALARPDLVRRLVLAEPPIMRWLPAIDGGEGIWEGFEERIWRPIGEAFGGGDDAGLDATARWYFRRPFAEIEPEWRRDFLDSVREWRALTTSADAFPWIPFERVAKLETPTLLLSGGRNAGGFNDLVDGRLAALLPVVRRVVVEGASHEMFLDEPALVATLVGDFLAEA